MLLQSSHLAAAREEKTDGETEPSRRDERKKKGRKKKGGKGDVKLWAARKAVRGRGEKIRRGEKCLKGKRWQNGEFQGGGVGVERRKKRSGGKGG